MPPEDFDFTPTVDAIDAVPSEFRGLYSKGSDGKFALNQSLAKRLDVSGLTGALEKERKRAKEYEKHVNGWKSLGLADTPEEAAELLKELQAEEGEEDEDGVKTKGKLDKKAIQKLKADAEAAVNSTKQEYEGKLTKVQEALKKQMIDGEASVAIAELKGVTGLLLPHIREKCLLLEEDGVYQVRVVDAEGDPRGNGKGGYMTVRELVAEMRGSDIYGRAFEADGKSGSGMRPGSSGNGGGTAQKLTPIQKIAKGLSRR